MDARALYPQVAPALVRSCTRLLGNRADAEDVVQQLFVDLIHRGRADLDFAYVHRAATNRALNRLRDHKRRAALLERQGQGVLWFEQPRVDERLLDQELLVEVVGRLDGRAAEVFALHVVEGMDQAEVARALGTSRRTVVKHVARIRALLVELVEQTDPGRRP